MVKGGTVVAGVAAGGSLIASGFLLVKGYLDKQIPGHILERLKRFYFYDTVAQKSLTIASLFQKGREGDWETYVLGVGQEGSLPNDILIEIGYDTVNKTYNFTFAKMAWNPIEIYLDEVLARSLPAYTVTTGNVSGVCFVLSLV